MLVNSGDGLGNAVYVDDLPFNLTPAEELGMATIHHTSAEETIPQLEALLDLAARDEAAAHAAKIAGVKLCENYNLQYGRHYFSGMPTNTFGPGDNYHPDYGHVMAALILKAHQARQQSAPAMTVWGSGSPRREFIYVVEQNRAFSGAVQGG